MNSLAAQLQAVSQSDPLFRIADEASRLCLRLPAIQRDTPIVKSVACFTGSILPSIRGLVAEGETRGLALLLSELTRVAPYFPLTLNAVPSTANALEGLGSAAKSHHPDLSQGASALVGAVVTDLDALAEAVAREVGNASLQGLIHRLSNAFAVLHGNVLNDLHDYDRSVQVHRRVLQAYVGRDVRDLLDDERLTLSSTLVSLARNFTEQGRLYEALRLLSDAYAALSALTQAESTKPAIDCRRVQILIDMARADYLRYNLADAVDNLGLASELLNDVGDPETDDVRALRSHIDLIRGIVQFCSGDYASASATLQKSLAFFERSGNRHLSSRSRRFLHLAQLGAGQASHLPRQIEEMCEDIQRADLDTLHKVVLIQGSAVQGLQLAAKLKRYDDLRRLGMMILGKISEVPSELRDKTCLSSAVGKIHLQIASCRLASIVGPDGQPLEREIDVHLASAIEAYGVTKNAKGLAKARFARGWLRLKERDARAAFAEFAAAIRLADAHKIVNGGFNFAREISLCAPDQFERVVERLFWNELRRTFDDARLAGSRDRASGEDLAVIRHMIASYDRIADFDRESIPLQVLSHYRYLSSKPAITIGRETF